MPSNGRSGMTGKGIKSNLMAIDERTSEQGFKEEIDRKEFLLDLKIESL